MPGHRVRICVSRVAVTGVVADKSCRVTAAVADAGVPC
jgi:hypothetical protein